MATLSLAVAASGGIGYNITSLGATDWLAYAGDFNPVAKAVARVIALSQISGSPGLNPYTGSGGPTFTWTDGNAPASGSAQGGVYTLNTPSNTGWSLTMPAGIATQRLRVFAGIFQGSGVKVTATLSDGSAPSVSDSSVTHSGGPNPTAAVYTIDFAAASAGQTLTVLVQAVNGGTLSLQGAALGAPPVVTAPGQPTNVAATPGSKSAQVTGQAPASNGGSPITGYRATSTPGNITGTSATLPVNVSGLTDGVAYTFTLAAKNDPAGYGPESAASASVTPSSVNNPPTFPGGSIASIAGQVGVAIAQVDVHALFLDSDTLTYSASPSGTAWPSGLSINSSTGVISGTVATAGTTAGIRVRATDTVGQSVDSNAFNVTIASGPTQVPYNDAALTFSPNSWDDRGTAKVTNNAGAYVKLAFNGTSVAAKVDVSALVAAGVGAGDYPIVRTVIDGRSVYDTQLTSSTTAVSVPAMNAGSHTVEFYLRALNVVSDRWNTVVSGLYFKGFTLDAGATYSKWQRPKVMMGLGDSIKEGYFAITDSSPGGNNALLAIDPIIAQALGCEYGQIGYSAQGYAQGGVGNVPALNAAIPFYSNGRPRLVSGLFPTQPDYIFVEHGANGNTSTANVTQVIDTLRAAAPNAWIFMQVPAGGFARGAITAGVAARSSDAKVVLIDLGSEFEVGINNTGASQYAVDGLHRNLLINAKIAAAVVRKAQAAIDGAPAIVPPTTTARTFSMQLATGLDASSQPIPAANLTGLKVRCYNPDGSLCFSTDSGSTDASGNVVVANIQSTASAGVSCLMTVLDATRNHSEFVTVT